MVFVDTGAWFAFFVPSDPQHAIVRQWLEGNDEPLVTSDYCVDETLTLLLARKRPRLAREAGLTLFAEELCRLAYLSPAQIQRAWIQFQDRLLEGWSFY